MVKECCECAKLTSKYCMKCKEMVCYSCRKDGCHCCSASDEDAGDDAYPIEPERGSDLDGHK